ncbi:hypothetical protein Ahy_B10g103336 [Arachis hypogaea]|uniref:Aminotransferase-like plant mobile domain-containing protein n=1 Tax=Arachis hypogaea TaxID=3818 RepID=A0A444X3I2_ARAHY|nr:hypothetical protein Ahy_B10g103336 [Arachis hypogaea]
MSKLFLPLAALLHEGKTLNLAKLLLGHIFEELGLLVCDLRDNKIINKGGPLWLFQLWLNAIFENYMIKPAGGNTDKQHIEGFRLSDYKPNFPNAQSDEDKFWAIFSLFHSYRNLIMINSISLLFWVTIAALPGSIVLSFQTLMRKVNLQIKLGHTYWLFK